MLGYLIFILEKEANLASFIFIAAEQNQTSSPRHEWIGNPELL
jgi:hypothetical protein